MQKILVAMALVIFSLFSMFGASHSFYKGDFNCNGNVDAYDLAHFTENYGGVDCSICVATPIPVTGQKVSYAFGDDGDKQMGIDWPVPRFSDNGDGTVKDRLTRLVFFYDNAFN